MTIRLDHDRLVTRRLGLGLSVRQLASDAGIELSVLHRLETGNTKSQTTVSMKQFIRLAECLAIDPGLLLVRDDRTDTAAPTSDDHATLTALLHDVPGQIATSVIAEALGWTITRVHETATQLRAPLAAVGLRLILANGNIALRADGDGHTQAVIAARSHPRAHPRQRLLTIQRAVFVHKALSQQLVPRSFTDQGYTTQALLARAGILERTTGGTLQVTEDVTLSLYPDGDPPAPLPRPERGYDVTIFE